MPQTFLDRLYLVLRVRSASLELFCHRSGDLGEVRKHQDSG